MATEQGKDTRIMIKSGAAFIPIGGETTFSWKRSSQELDTSSKDDGIYGSSTYGQQRITISPSGNLKTPDAGISALEAASKANPPEVEVKIMKGTLVRYDGVVAIGNFSAEFPLGLCTWSCDMTNAGVPTIDDLMATAA